ncbi:MAG: HAMP domain-containing histidine kinase, partial [Pseudomonadales bacterium]|nr:HAMP domain-containing histidine kinase [Pseudomonadales bacterium]
MKNNKAINERRKGEPMKAMVSLLIIVLTPLTVIVWLGVQWMQNDFDKREQQQLNLVKSQLTLIDQRFTTLFYEVEQALRALPVSPPFQAESLRKIVLQEPLISFLFVLDTDKNRLFPPQDNQLLSQKEKVYFDQATYLTDSSLFKEASVDNSTDHIEKSVSPQNRFSSSRLYRSSYLEKQRLAITGSHWNIFYSQNQINQIFWYNDSLENVIGFQLDPVRVMAMIIEVLPDTLSKDNLFFNARVRLRKAGAQTLYEWGNYEPLSGALPTEVYPLSHPLGAWKFEYFAPKEEESLIIRWAVFLLLVSLVGAGCMGLAFSLYRNNKKERQEALQKVSFVNQVSHELKTPLTNIRMYAELLQGRLDETDEKVRHFSEVIVSESEHLSRLVHNVLSFGQSQSNKLSIQKSPVVIDEIVLDVIDKFSPTFKKKEMYVTQTLDAGGEVSLDKFAIEQILNNLLSNVEKYAFSGKRIDISTTQDEMYSEITVRDWGPGVPEAESKKIFEAFYRIHHSTTEGVAGTGIGLNIAQQLAEPVS